MSRAKSQRPSIVFGATALVGGAAVRLPLHNERRALDHGFHGGRSRSVRSLQEQVKALSDLNQRKDEFMAMLGHELRNPLGAIRNAVHVLGLLRNEDPLQERARTIIERQVTQMTRLVDDLMEVSRIATGTLQLRQDRILMSSIVKSAVDTVRPLMNQRRHQLDVSLPHQPIWLCADAARLEQVIVNLLVNAAKYTSEGGHVRLTVEQEADECVLRLRDTGMGIAPELLSHVFDLFVQEERSLEQSRGGLGIGLALVKRLVEMHQGSVEVDSTVGQGSEFVVRLPVALPLAPPLLFIPAETVAFSLPRLPVPGIRGTGPSATTQAERSYN